MLRKKLAMIFQGGAGDILAASPVVRIARKTYPDDEIIVLSTYPDIFKHNPNIDLLIPLKDPDQIGDFYSAHLLGQEVRYFRKFFPYDHWFTDARYKSSNLRDFLVRLYGLEPDGNSFPDYFITEYEKRAADVFLRQESKPVILLQMQTAVPSENGMPQRVGCPVCGGKGVVRSEPSVQFGTSLPPHDEPCGACFSKGYVVQRQKTNNLKDLSVNMVAPLVEKYKKDFNFLQIGLEGEPLVPGAFDCLNMPLRDTIALIQHPQVKSFIFPESIFHHCAGAFKKPGVVVFQNTDPAFFGYSTAFNVWNHGGCDLWPCNRPLGAILDFNPGYKNPKTRERLLWECPDQKCARMTTEELEKVFVESITPPKEAPKGGAFKTLAEAQDA